MIKILIVDDEKPTRELIERMVQSYKLNVEIHSSSNNVKSAIANINSFKPNIILLDIQMPDGNGFDVLKNVESVNFHVIFITAYQEFAIQAIKFSALDYLLKPIDSKELKESLTKAISAIEENQINANQLNALGENLTNFNRKKLVLKTQESNYVVPIEEIIRCESDKNYTFFYLNNGKKILVSKTLKDFDTLLTPYQFFRVQQSHLINLNFVDRYDKADGGSVIMKDNSSVPLSSQKKELFFKSLESL